MATRVSQAGDIVGEDDTNEANLGVSGTFKGMAVQSQLNPSSEMSGSEDKDLAEFVSAVVTVQTYLHDAHEKKKVNAGLTRMDSFEFKNFYKGMLYGVNDPATAVKHIVTCQSAVRRMIAKKRAQEMWEYE